MVGKKLIGIIMILVLMMSLFSGCTNKSDVDSDKIKIGITQIIEHPALDAARSGFIDALDKNGYKDGENIIIEVQNAQGDIPTAQIIAKNFASDKKDLILAIATPTAQAAYNATKDIPILITAVTDPIDAGLAKAWDKTETNVTGTSDLAPIQKQFELMKKLLPNVKTIGILYNTSEANSVLQVQMAKDIASKLNLNVKLSGVTNTNEVAQSTDVLIGNVDAIYIPTDNTIASAIALVVSKCNENNIPVIGSEAAHVNNGALATEGIDYYKLGFQTGEMAVEVLKGKKPQDMAVTTLKSTELVINMDAAKKLNIEIPDELKNNAKLVEEGK